MTTKQITEKFKVHNAQQFVESLTEPSPDVYYVFIGKQTPYDNDAVAPNVNTAHYATTYTAYDEMIHGKRVLPTNVAMMTRRIDWTNGTVYDAFDGSTPDWSTKDYYVVSPEAGDFHVFKCLNNNKGAQSVYAPLFSSTSPTADSFYTADGYQWKFMYTISPADWSDFATDNHIPVYNDTDVQGAAVDGAIDTIKVENGGKNYKSHATGNFVEVGVSGDQTIYEISGTELSIDDQFYKNSAMYITVNGVGQVRKIIDYNVIGDTKRVTLLSAFNPLPTLATTFNIAPNVNIKGDGEGAIARSVANTTDDTIHSIEVIDRGSDYSYADITVTGNTGFISDPVADTAVANAIIGPVGGHGSDNFNELSAGNVGISVIFDKDEGGNLSANNEFRTVGLIKNALMANVALDITYTDTPRFLDEDYIVDANTAAFGQVSLVPNGDVSHTINVTDVHGIFSENSSLLSGSTLAEAQANTNIMATIDAAGANHNVINNNVFDQRWSYNVEQNSVEVLAADETVVQDKDTPLEATATVHELAGALLFTNENKGEILASDLTGDKFVTGETSGAVYKVIDYNIPDMVYASGDIMYLENVLPVTRTSDTKEKFKLIINF